MARGDRGRYVAVLDDDPAILATVQRMLVRSGFHAVPFGSTAEAVDGFEAGSVSLAIVDILMPDRDGIDAILALRRIDPELRIIAMSGGGARMPSGLALATADAFGADAVLQKPFTRRQLVETIATAMNRSDPA